MEIMEIVREAFEFPSKNLGTFSIYVVLSILAGAFAVKGMFLCTGGLINFGNFLMGIISLIISVIIGVVLSGYSISLIKSGIQGNKDVPEFEWEENLTTGINNVIVSIVYYIIPAFIVLIVGYLTNINGIMASIAKELGTQVTSIYAGSSTIVVTDTMSRLLTSLSNSLLITIIIAVILFVLFSFLLVMAEGRLANTGNLEEALNIVEAAKDITRIGTGKVISLILLIFVIYVFVELVLSIIFVLIPFLSSLSILVTPFFVFFTQRAIGLLYSDIA